MVGENAEEGVVKGSTAQRMFARGVTVELFPVILNIQRCMCYRSVTLQVNEMLDIRGEILWVELKYVARTVKRPGFFYDVALCICPRYLARKPYVNSSDILPVVLRCYARV